MSKLSVTVRRNLVHGYGLTFAFDPRMVNAIKTRIPADRRSYDPATRTWWLHSASDVAELRWATLAWADFTRIKGGDGHGGAAAG